MTGYWPSYFVSVHKNAKKKKRKKKKRRRSVSGLLDRTSLVNIGFIIWLYLTLVGYEIITDDYHLISNARSLCFLILMT